MNRGEIWRTREALAERGNKPGFYVIVSRRFVAQNADVATVVCAPIYTRILGLATEVILGPDDGIPHASAIRCDFLSLVFKSKLTEFVAVLRAEKLDQLDRALALALEIAPV